MTSSYDRYLERITVDRTQAQVEQVRSLAQSQAQIEHQILGAANDLTDAELHRLLDQAVEQSQTQLVTQWDLLRSQQMLRLSLYRVVFDLRAMIWVVATAIVCLGVGTALGYGLASRSPPANQPQIQSIRTIR